MISSTFLKFAGVVPIEAPPAGLIPPPLIVTPPVYSVTPRASVAPPIFGNFIPGDLAPQAQEGYAKQAPVWVYAQVVPGGDIYNGDLLIPEKRDVFVEKALAEMIRSYPKQLFSSDMKLDRINSDGTINHYKLLEFFGPDEINFEGYKNLVRIELRMYHEFLAARKQLFGSTLKYGNLDFVRGDWQQMEDLLSQLFEPPHDGPVISSPHPHVSAPSREEESIDIHKIAADESISDQDFWQKVLKKILLGEVILPPITDSDGRIMRADIYVRKFRQQLSQTYEVRMQTQNIIPSATFMSAIPGSPLTILEAYRRLNRTRPTDIMGPDLSRILGGTHFHEGIINLAEITPSEKENPSAWLEHAGLKDVPPEGILFLHILKGDYHEILVISRENFESSHFIGERIYLHQPAILQIKFYLTKSRDSLPLEIHWLDTFIHPELRSRGIMRLFMVRLLKKLSELFPLTRVTVPVSLPGLFLANDLLENLVPIITPMADLSHIINLQATSKVHPRFLKALEDAGILTHDEAKKIAQGGSRDWLYLFITIEEHRKRDVRDGRTRLKTPMDYLIDRIKNNSSYFEDITDLGALEVSGRLLSEEEYEAASLFH